MLQYNPSISGSLSVTGSLIVTNGVIGTVNGVDIQIFSSSISQVVTNIQTATGSQDGRLTSIESFTSSTSARLGSIETVSASNMSRLTSIETITASNISRLNSIETITASNIARLTSLEITTGSLATTGSNTFIGTQTITGSLFISSNLIVQGSSSLQNITASAVSIGTNIVNLNTANPAIRYAGLVIGDSGSVGGSGSFLYDSVQDEMLFIHRGDSSVVTSSVALMGPETYDNVGNEIYLTNNRLPKGTGKEHLIDSCIQDINGVVTIGGTLCTSGIICSSNLDVTGTGRFGGMLTMSNVTEYLRSVQSGTASQFQSWYASNGTTRKAILGFRSSDSDNFTLLNERNGSLIFGTNDATALTIASAGAATFSSTSQDSFTINTTNTDGPVVRIQNSGNNLGLIGNAEGVTNGGTTNFAIRSTNNLIFATGGANNRLTIASTGIACFSCQICSPSLVVSGNINEQLVLNFVADFGSYTHQSFRLNGVNQYRFTGNTNGNFVLRNDIISTDVLTMSCTGIATFTNTICTPLLTVNSAVRLYGSAGGIGCAYIVTATGTNEQPAIILEKAGGFGQSEIRTYYNDVPNYGMAFRAGNTTGVYINSSGYLGVGTSNPLTSFTVKSTNDNGYALTRPSDASVYHWRLSTTETGGDAYYTAYNTFNTEMLFSTYASGGTGGNVIWRTSSNGVGNLTERMRITPGGVVAIGKNDQSGNAALTVKSPAGGNTGIILIEGDTANNGWGMYAVTTDEYRITRFTNGSYSDKLSIASTGEARFDNSIYLTNGQVNSLGAAGGGQPMYLNFQGNGAIYAGSSYAVLYAGSDRRIKSDIEDANPTLNKILSLTPRTFKYKERPEFTNYGFIAQELEEVMPELVKTAEGISICDGEEIVNQKSIESYGLAWASILVKAIQELKSEHDILKSCLGIS
jgi:hypothetical protein